MSDRNTDRETLTDEERRVVATALDAGYYAQPRETTHTEVAVALESDPVTVARTLRKVERDTLRAALD